MLTKLNSFIINCSTSWWKTLLLIIGFAGTISSLMRITASFPDASGGHEPFDMQNTLAATDIFDQLATYTDQAFELYAIFQFVDYFFPLFGGLMMATLCAFALRALSAKVYAVVVEKKLLLLFLVPTVFDWLENITLLWAVSAWPEQVEAAATLAVTAKMAKLVTLFITQPVAILLLIAGLSKWLYTKATSGRNTTAAS
jgi:hypothetical protein